MVKAFQGADRWWPIEYKRDWEAIRKVAAATGEAFDLLNPHLTESRPAFSINAHHAGS
jgi:hypothetical protein